MKRTLLTVCALAAFAAASWAQVTFPTATFVSSLQSRETAGLLQNEIDQSFTANGAFGSVANPFLLAGVFGNPARIANTTGSSSFNAGYYQNGSTPFSVYGYFTAIATNTANIGTASANATTSVAYSDPSIRSLNGWAQGLVKLGGITTGLVFGYNPSTSYFSGGTDSTGAMTDYSTTIVTTLSGTTPDYKTTTTLNNMGAVGDFAGANYAYSNTTFSVPLYLKTGDLEHSAFVGVNLKGKDNSATASRTTTAYAVTAGTTVTDIDQSIKSATNQTSFEGNYVLTMPGFFGKDKGNKFSAGIDITDAIISSSYTLTGTATTYDVSTVGSKVKTATATQTITNNYSNLNYLRIAAMAKHSFNFVPAEGLSFGLTPQVIASYDNNPSSAYNSIVSSIGSATLTSTTTTMAGVTTTTQTPTDTRTSLSDVGLSLNLPTAFKVKPEAWPFGLYGGATPYATFAWTTTEVAYYTTNTLTTSASSTAFSTSFGESHVFGIFIPLAGDIRADIAMNGSNLLDFDSLTLQIYVPLK